MKNKRCLITIIFVIFLLAACSKKEYVVFKYNCKSINDYKCELRKKRLYCDIKIPTCEGKEFLGWYDAKENGNEINLYSEFNDKDTIYADWKEKEEPSSEEESSLIEESSSNIEEPSSTIEEESSLKEASSYIEEPSSSKLEEPSSQAVYTITFNGNGGSTTISSKSVTYDKALPSIGNEIPSRIGYTFTGWYDNSEYIRGTQYYNSSNSPVKEKYAKTSNVILYAGWKANTYTITFNSGGGNTTNSSKDVTYYQSLPSLENIPTKDGYEFLGWYDDKTRGIQYYNASNIAVIKKYTITSNITLYAHWRENVLSIRYNGNGGIWNTSTDKYLLNVDGTVIVANTNKTYEQKLKYGEMLDSTGLIDYNGASFSWKKNGYYVKSGLEYFVQSEIVVPQVDPNQTPKKSLINTVLGWIGKGNNTNAEISPTTKTLRTTELDQNVSYTAKELANYGGCDLSKQSCTITVKVNWKKGTIIRLATFNVGYFACGSSKISCSPTTDQIVSLINDNHIDVIGMQEARDTNIASSGYCHYTTYKVKRIKNSLNYNDYITCPTNVNAILSNYEFESKDTTFMGCGEKRALDKVVIKINGVKISYYNTHFGLRDCNTEHFEKAAKILSEDPNPIIITGDYNHIYKTKFEKYFIPLGFEFAAYDTSTNNMWSKQSYCDAVLINSKGHIDVIDSKTVEVYANYSDHNFVYAVLSIH